MSSDVLQFTKQNNYDTATSVHYGIVKTLLVFVKHFSKISDHVRIRFQICGTVHGRFLPTLSLSVWDRDAFNVSSDSCNLLTLGDTSLRSC